MEKKEKKRNVEESVEMLHDLYNAMQGKAILLEDIQDNPNYEKKNKDLRKKNAFKTLIATILSVRSKDETTFKVIEKLWKQYSTPKQIAYAPIEHLEELVYSSGTYVQKTKRIKESARIIHEEYNDLVPAERKKLLKLPGVGRKVANCVLVVSYNIPAIPVDIHVHRISNRIGWVKTKTPRKTEIALENLFPKSEWLKINITLVRFGKNVCKPRKPICKICPINKRCMKII